MSASRRRRTSEGDDVVGPERASSISEQLLLSPVEAAKRLGIGRSTLYLLLTGGELESVHVGARRLIPADALVDFVERLRKLVAASAPPAAGTMAGPTEAPAPRTRRTRSDSQPTLPLATWNP